MVNINQISFTQDNGKVLPYMHQHQMTIKKDAPGGFKEGESGKFYITRYSDQRLAVFDCFAKETRYHVFNDVQELHDTFDELSTN